jgi:hypothetical protein
MISAVFWCWFDLPPWLLLCLPLKSMSNECMSCVWSLLHVWINGSRQIVWLAACKLTWLCTSNLSFWISLVFLTVFLHRHLFKGELLDWKRSIGIIDFLFCSVLCCIQVWAVKDVYEFTTLHCPHAVNLLISLDVVKWTPSQITSLNMVCTR